MLLNGVVRLNVKSMIIFAFNHVWPADCLDAKLGLAQLMPRECEVQQVPLS